MYKIAAQTQGAEVISVDRIAADGFRLDQQAMLDTLQDNPQIKLVFLTSPNNPTGDVIDPDFLRELLQLTREQSIVVLDEAYAEFSDQPTAISLIDEFEHLAVLRTLSKAWASAGLRCGAVIAQPVLINLLRRVIAPYPLPSPVVDLALRMLEKPVLKKQKKSLIHLQSNKQFLLESLRGLSFIREILPGEANFVLIRVDNPDEVLTFCAANGVIIRGFPADPMLADYLRISVGSESDLSALLVAFEEWETGK
jgi:histidinol-phosphate aminotransferase